MRRRTFVIAAVIAAIACVDAPRTERVPADAFFSVGVVLNSGNIPQSSNTVKLAFAGGKPGPSVVVAQRVDAPITVDGDDSDWASIPGSTVPLLSPFGILGLSKQDTINLYTAYWIATGACPPLPAACSRTIPTYDFGVPQITVKAAWDGDRLWMLLKWADPDETRAARPWIFQATTGKWVKDTIDEDKAFISFDIRGTYPAHDSVGCASGCHVKDGFNPKDGTTDPTLVADSTRFRMRTEAAGERVDHWYWRAARTDPLGLADDQFWDEVTVRGDCPDPPACSQLLYTDPSTAAPGVSCASTTVGTTTTYVPPCSKSMNVTNGSSTPTYYGADGVNSSPPFIYYDGFAKPGVLPFPTTDTPGDGARIPSVALQWPSAHRDEVRAQGRWNNGVWTVELERKLVTGDPNDAQFPIQ